MVRETAFVYSDRLSRHVLSETHPMKPVSSTRYPWATETPGPRLRASCARARTGIEQVNAPGNHHQIAERIDAAVQALRPLVETAEYVSRAGLRARGTNKNAVSGTTVSGAVDAVREALSAMAASTAPMKNTAAITLSAHFEAFVAAVETLVGLVDTGIELGIAGTGEAAPHDPWHAYGA